MIQIVSHKSASESCCLMIHHTLWVQNLSHTLYLKCSPLQPIWFWVAYVSKTIIVTHPENLSGTWSLLLRLALNFGRSSEFWFNIGWWHFDRMQGLSLFYSPGSLLACAWLHVLSRVNFGVECFFRHCNLDLWPHYVHPRGGGSNKQITLVKHWLLLVTSYNLHWESLYSSALPHKPNWQKMMLHG